MRFRAIAPCTAVSSRSPDGLPRPVKVGEEIEIRADHTPSAALMPLDEDARRAKAATIRKPGAGTDGWRREMTPDRLFMTARSVGWDGEGDSLVAEKVIADWLGTHFPDGEITSW